MSPSSEGLLFLTISFGTPPSCCLGTGPSLSPSPAAQNGGSRICCLPCLVQGGGGCQQLCLQFTVGAEPGWLPRGQTPQPPVPLAGPNHARWLLFGERMCPWDGGSPGPLVLPRGLEAAPGSKGGAYCMVALLQLHPRGGWTSWDEGRLSSSLCPHSWRPV